MLEEFFRSYATALGLADAPQYSLINSLAENAYENKQTPMTVDTSFLGTRTDPDKRGSISLISKDNFTPQGLILGVICGICKELYELYLDTGVKKELVVASGGAVRKNKILRNLIEDTFGLPLILSNIKEEAATGAALFGALAAGKITYSDGFSDFIGSDQEDI
jgi:sedoheptulokinase